MNVSNAEVLISVQHSNNNFTSIMNDNSNKNNSNVTTVIDDCSEQLILYTPPAQIIFSFLYFTIFTLGTFGNVLVSLAVIR